MADLEQALKARATAFAGLVALIGTRFYPVVLPQNPTLPAVSYQRISAFRPRAMGGRVGQARVRIQMTAWSLDYGVAKAVRAKVFEAFDEWDGTAAGVEVEHSGTDSERDLFDEDLRLHGLSLDFMIWHREA